MVLPNKLRDNPRLLAAHWEEYTMTYDFSPLNNQSSIIPVLQTANTMANNLLGVFILVVVGLALFFTVRRYNTNRASFAAATFVTAILSIFFALMGLVTVYIPGAFIILLMLSVVFLYYQSN